MNRSDFLKFCGLLGIGWPALNSFDMIEPKEGQKVIIIGAGAGGMTVGYLLKQKGIDFEIHEASNQYGGRMRINKEFADFPIPLGSEWLETGTYIFDHIVNDVSKEVNIQTKRDFPDRKFVNYSWFSFFEDYIEPSIKEHIKYKSRIVNVNYFNDRIILNSESERLYCDKLVVSVPLQILKDGDILFKPMLPKSKRSAISNARVWEGFKAFIEFSDKFYDKGKLFHITPKTDGQKLYYDATWKQNSNRHILGLFTVGKPAQDYITISEEGLKKFILDELDEIYDGKATPNYVKHITQNWNQEPFIRGGYLSDHESSNTVYELGKSVQGKIFFAGGPYTTGKDWVSVHAAALSAFRAVKEMFQ